MITAAALAALIAFTPPGEAHPTEVCWLMEEYAMATFEGRADPPVGEELEHIAYAVSTWEESHPGAFYWACRRGEI